MSVKFNMSAVEYGSFRTDYSVSLTREQAYECMLDCFDDEEDEQACLTMSDEDFFKRFKRFVKECEDSLSFSEIFTGYDVQEDTYSSGGGREKTTFKMEKKNG